MSDKEELRQAFVEGFRYGRNVEEIDSVSLRTAKSRFERWYSLNHDDD